MDSIQLPDKIIIDKWDDIESPPLMETVPRSVPQSTFIRYPAEGDYQHVLSGKFKGLAEESEEYIDILKSHTDEVQRVLSDLYTRRGISKPLHSHIEKLKESQPIGDSNDPNSKQRTPAAFLTPEASEMANQILMPIKRLLRNENSLCISCSMQIKVFFAKDDFWTQGKYNDDFLDALCLFWLRMASLAHLGPNKNCLINDISSLKKLVTGKTQKDELQTLLWWFINPRSISDQMLQDLSSLSPDTTILIFDIFFNHIRKNIENPTFLNPELQFAYHVTLIFMIQLYVQNRDIEKDQCSKNKKQKPKMKELSSSVHDFLAQLIDTYPLTPLYFEIAQNTGQNLPDSFKINSQAKKASFSMHRYDLQGQLRAIRSIFSELSSIISLLKENKNHKERFTQHCSDCFNAVQNILHQIAQAMNDIRTLIVNQLAYPPPSDEQMTPYERSMKIGLKDHYDMIMLLLCTCRSSRELIHDNLPIIQQAISSHIFTRVQSFLYEKLPEIFRNNLGQRKILEPIFTELRVFAGYFNNNEQLKMDNKPDKKKPIVLPAPGPTMNIAIIDLLRHKLQAMINPESPLSSKNGIRSSQDIKDIGAFLDDSRHFSELMRLSETLDITCDQSNLFFKEYYLSSYDVSFFPVSTSLPFILTDHALNNYSRLDLTSTIYYPLSIYDDAASTALKRLKCKYLYEEIKAEAEIAILSITKMIANSIFQPLRVFSSLRIIDQLYLKRLLVKLKVHDPINATRMGVILQQNKLFVLGCYIDIKTQLSGQLNELFKDHIIDTIRNLSSSGLFSAIAVKKLLDMLRGTHEMLANLGIPLIPFDDILAIEMRTDTPNSLQSTVMDYVYSHISNHIYGLRTISYPLMLVPNTIKVPILDLTGSGAFNDLLQKYLSGSMSMITTESFRALFSFMDDGTIAVLHRKILEIIDEVFEQFIEDYSKVRDTLQRIRSGGRNLSSIQYYQHYEGAYNSFINDYDVLGVMNEMMIIGNILTISEMMDNAFLMKRETNLQNQAFIFNHQCTIGKFSDEEEAQSGYNSQKADMKRGMEEPDLFKCFDQEFQSTQSILYKGLSNSIIPKHNQILPPFLYASLQRLATLINESKLLQENSQNILDTQSMDGFAVVWIILEFIYCLIEIFRSDDNVSNDGSLKLFGEGPLQTAAAFLLISKQSSLYNVHNIGRIITNALNKELNVRGASNVAKFSVVYKFVESSMRCALTNYQSVVDEILSKLNQ